MIARVLAQRTSEKWGQTVLVENKPGATGAIGAAQVAKAAPDGYTLLVSSLAVFVVNPHLQKGLQYDPSRDFDLLTVAVQAPTREVIVLSNFANVIAQLIDTVEGSLLPVDETV